MANVKIKDGQGAIKERKSSGDGSASDPFVPVTSVKTLALEYLGKNRSIYTDAPEEFGIPTGSKMVILSCAPDTFAYIEQNDDASTSSPIYVRDPFPIPAINLGEVTKLSVYVLEGHVGAWFFG